MLIQADNRFRLSIEATPAERDLLARELTELLYRKGDQYPLTFRLFAAIETAFAGVSGEHAENYNEQDVPEAGEQPAEDWKPPTPERLTEIFAEIESDRKKEGTSR